MDRPADGAEFGRNTPTMLVRAARHSRDARIRFWRVFIVAAFFAVVLSANLFVGAAVMFGSIRANADAENAAASNKTARMTRALLDGTFCRYTVFDNNSAQAIEDRIERCDLAGNKPKLKSKAEFSWGGK